MRDIYVQHSAAFQYVEAYVILDGTRERVATVAFKKPRDGAGRLYCYLHIFGTRMVRGCASGYGYDKHSAAIAAAAQRVETDNSVDREQAGPTVAAFKAALRDSGYTWKRELQNAGFTVLQAV